MLSEHEQQKLVFKWAEKYPEIYKTMFAVPNGGLRNKSVAIKLKQEGVKSGIPDIQICLMRKGKGGMFIELKTQKGRVSPTQQDWIKRLNDNGYHAIVAYGYEQAIQEIKNYVFDNEMH